MPERDKAAGRTGGAAGRPALAEMLCALLFVIITAALPRGAWGMYLAAAAAALGGGALSGMPWARQLKRLIRLEPFAAGTALLALFQENGAVIFATMLIKSTLCLYVMVILSGTVPFDRILAAFRVLRLPALMVAVLALMHRYFFVLWDEFERMRRAVSARSFGRGRWFTVRTLAGLVGLLFVRSAERAERVFAAMTARGWRV